MKIFLYRHGETVLNAQKRWQGRLDSPLTKEGLKQAKEAAEYLQDKRIDTIFSSPLGRARRSASFLREKFSNAEYFEEDALKEIDNGKADGLTWQESKKRFPHLLKRIILEDLTNRFPGGESYDGVVARLEPFVEKLKKEFGKKTVAIIGHGGVNRMLLRILFSLPDEKVIKISTPNDIIYEIDLNGSLQVHNIKNGKRKGGLVFRNLGGG